MLLLFDIDGTLLLRAADGHRDAFYVALHEVFALAPSDGVRLHTAGKTDGQIAREVLARHGIPPGEIDRRAGELRDAWCAAYAQGCEPDLSHTVAPGMRELLEDLGAREDVRLALLTGNHEPIARLKLARAGIGHHFPAGQGAFGSDHEERERLPAIARARAGDPPRDRTVVIGDTPRDIACARADGVRAVAVATGQFGPEDLTGADAVAPDAAALRPILHALLAAY